MNSKEMSFRDENICFHFRETVDTLGNILDMLSLGSTKLDAGNKLEAKNIIDLEAPLLTSTLVKLRNIYTALDTPSFAVRLFSGRVTNSLGISFEILGEKKYPCYKVTFPLSTSKKKVTAEMKQLFADCFLSCIKEYIPRIERIAKPVIYFEHRFDKYGGKSSIKDVDNYETSSHINLFQMHLIKDDRDAVTIHTNRYNTTKCETVIYIFPQKNLLDFLSNNTTF